MKIIPFLLFIGCLLSGCAPSGGSVPSGVKTENAPKSGTDSGQESVAANPDVAQTKEVSQELQHDGYHWYGLSNKKEIKYRATLSNGAPLEGTQINKFIEEKDGKASFEVTRTDGMKIAFGDEPISLEKDGIYTLGSSNLDTKLHSLELPADLSPGKTWKNSADLKMKTGGSMTTSQTYKVVGMDKVKTPVATRDALKITASGEATIGGVKYTATNQFWYVKDFGLVKSTTVLQPKTGKPQSITIEELPS